MSESDSDSDEHYCAYCTAGYLAAHRDMDVWKCGKCGAYTCYHHGDVMHVIRVIDARQFPDKEWQCYECNGRAVGAPKGVFAK